MYWYAYNANACRRREPLIVPPFLCRLLPLSSILFSPPALLFSFFALSVAFSSLLPSFNNLSFVKKGLYLRAQPGPLRLPPSVVPSFRLPNISHFLFFFFFFFFFFPVYLCFSLFI
ncbi:uncharacterized protein EURHEDRAFT_63157 [Aspergillus ruber CBS 135680]|uniref:Transmembrane protein n=1 Tax=Aspergillus ruber (strain CBS 135680) TaxID=1388766 RepID=A0A017SEQ1_ASPRC|nr:uncharacterized protein EURHEDRAFT_63157 [Aspergillus ruber CBS 135680]EYE95084.1 hypothetical protein EURHEDRAFT_63157 [Aspergillus ruber CBS 135680]